MVDITHTPLVTYGGANALKIRVKHGEEHISSADPNLPRAVVLILFCS